MAVDISDLEVPSAQPPVKQGIDISDLEVPMNLSPTTQGIQKNAQEIEPGVYGDTDPAGQKILENFGKVAGGYGIGSLGAAGLNAASDTTLGKAILNSPKDLSPEYDALHEAAGISKDLPVQRGNVLKFPNLAGQPSNVPPPFAPAIAPLSYAKDPNTLINLARGRMSALGDQLSPQELNDYKTLIGQMIDTGKVGSGTPLAMAAQARAQASDLLNNRVDGLAELNKVYGLSTKLRNPSQFLPDAVQAGVAKYGPWFGRAVAVKLGLSI